MEVRCRVRGVSALVFVLTVIAAAFTVAEDLGQQGVEAKSEKLRDKKIESLHLANDDKFLRASSSRKSTSNLPDESMLPNKKPIKLISFRSSLELLLLLSIVSRV
jgi:hypothetical protein